MRRSMKRISGAAAALAVAAALALCGPAAYAAPADPGDAGLATPIWTIPGGTAPPP